VIEACVATAGTAPSGANLQPWHFVVVENPAIKRQIRDAAEREEQDFYEHRAPPEWLEALTPLGTTADKPFLETAPVLIAVFAQLRGLTAEGQVRQHYYPLESTGIAIGLLIAALHHAGLVCLPYTPSRRGFLNAILARPKQERPMLILVTGYPAENVRVPQLGKKPLDEIVTFV
jgi:nitroreductase